MRLLHVKADGEFSLTEFFGEIPPYAVLSHTWGPDSEEVSFKDLMKRRGKDKSGYKKLRFCATQAAHDGLAYFWVDTCCIDKSSSAELSEAINSMFSWYKKAAKCYVFLADVSWSTWRSTFVKSKWFTRGWTLQELLAPTSVTFFTQHGIYLGNKYTLLADIQKTTNIPAHALLESHLSMNNFTVEERLSWAAGRETKREEDAAYSLLGLFDLHMPLIYGEGRAKAFLRLRKEIRSTSDNKDVNDLHTPLFEMIRPNHIEPFQTTKTRLTITRDPLAVMNTRHQKWWREAISDGKSPESNHERVSVLLIRWANEFDELQTYEEVEELESVFHEHFHFRTNIVELSAQNEFEARDQFDLHVDSFVRLHDGSRNLLIIYYAGNGWYIPDIKHMVLRRAQSNPLSPQLRHIQGDILAILDTPYTSVVGADQIRNVEEDVAYIESEERLKQRRRFELMTVGEDLGGIRGKTFTRSLTDALRKHRTESFSTRDLHKWILKDTQRSETPLMLWSLLPNKQNICLAPVQPPQMQMVRDQNLSSGYLKLGLAFGEDSLNRDQIKHLVHALTRTIDPEIVPLCRVDLLDFKRYTLISRFQRVASVVRAVLRWKTYVRERKEWRRMEWRRLGLWDD